MSSNLVIKRSQLVTAKLGSNSPAVGDVIKFSDIPEINKENILVYGIECFTADQLTKDEAGHTVVSSTGAKGIVLNLVVRGTETEVKQIPVTNLIRSNVNGFYTLLDKKRISLTESSIELFNNASLNADEVLLFNFYYVKLNK